MRGSTGTRGIRRAAAAAVASAAAALGCAGGAQAAYPGANGKIAVATGDGIAVIRADGTGFTRLTRGEDRSPAWSPDGRRIAFEHGGDVWVMAADGSHRRRVTSAAGDERHPTWSPDGSRIAFESASGVYVTSVNGGAASFVADGRAPAWSPDGDRIAYVSDARRAGDYPMGPRMSVWTAAPDGSDARRVRLTSYAADPDWSPRGDRIAFDQTTAIGEADWTAADGSGPLRALGASLGGDLLASGATWSPDGRFLAYSVFRDSSPAIVVENVNTGGVREIPVEGFSPDWQPVSRTKARRIARRAHRRR